MSVTNIFRGRRRWRLITLSVAIALVYVLLAGIHPFLACTHAVPARSLIVEGWLPPYALDEAVREFHKGNYDRIFTIGATVQENATNGASHDLASASAAGLKRRGIPAHSIIAVAALPTYRNRTFLSAVALRDYASTNGIRLDAINLISLGAHARRSRLCVQRALGRSVEVGVLSVENLDYDPGRWWKFSEGVKEVCGEAIAFAYAWLFIDYGN